MPAAVQVQGLRELQAAFAHADRQTRLGLRAGLRHVAEPVQRDAEQLAVSEIRRMPRSPRWSKMRIGVTRRLVYVAPRQRGVTTRRAQDPRRRPNLATLLMDRAMEPALERNTEYIVRSTEELLDFVADQFNEGGPVA